MTVWAYIEKEAGRRKITDKWVPIKPIYHEFTKGKNKGKFSVVMVNGKSAIATSIRGDKDNCSKTLIEVSVTSST